MRSPGSGIAGPWRTVQAREQFHLATVQSYAKAFDVKKVMGRVMDRVANNPVRIDVGAIERHSRLPLGGR